MLRKRDRKPVGAFEPLARFFYTTSYTKTKTISNTSLTTALIMEYNNAQTFRLEHLDSRQTTVTDYGTFRVASTRAGSAPATRVSPVTRERVLRVSPPLHEQPTLAIEQKNGECPVKM